MSEIRTSVIVLAYGHEEHLGDCVAAVLGNTSVDVELIVVDNGAERAVSLLPEDPRLRVLRPGSNLGYASGCNYGASVATGRYLVFLNSDAIVVDSAVDNLVTALSDSSIGLACGSVRLAASPENMNSAGNPVHYLGVAWAGGHGDPAALHALPADVPSVSGAFFGVRADVWASLEGFCGTYFAYHEDVELSLRAWQRGWRVRFVPDAIVLHHYHFFRNATKNYLVERNRWLTVLTVYPTGLLRWVLPAMLVFEVPVCVMATAQGWLPAKLRGWRWLLAHRAEIARRRRAVQAISRTPIDEFAGLLSAHIEPAMIKQPPGLAVLNAMFATYWSIVVKRLRPRPADRSDTR
jgi:GT2 family glycosyltransferase